MMATEWIPLVTRRETPLWVSLVCAGGDSRWFSEALGWDYAIRNYKYESDTHHISVGDAVELQRIIDEQADEMRFFENYLSRCISVCSRLDHVSETVAARLDSVNPESLSLDTLAGAYKEFTDAVLLAMPFLASLVLVQDRLEALLRKTISDATGWPLQSAEVADSLSVCVVSPRDTNVVREARSTLALATMLQETGVHSKRLTAPSGSGDLYNLEKDCPGFTTALNEHIAEFGWLRTFTYRGEPFSTGEMLARIQAHLERGNCRAHLDATLQNSTIDRERANETAERLLGASGRSLFQLAGNYLYWRFERIDVHFRSEFRLRNLESLLMRVIDRERDDLIFTTHQEIFEWLTGKCAVPAETYELHARRTRGFACYVRDGEFSVSTAPVIKRSQVPDDPGDGWPLRGTVACRGHASGTARIVLSADTMYSVDKGNILVTTMTTPDLMLAIERCSGIVTDEGGLLCHAAIISRELRIPCVIGTNFATRLIPDGSNVELNAMDHEGFVSLAEVVR
jgi:phosphohistidine swiveling domain-containing protein